MDNGAATSTQKNIYSRRLSSHTHVDAPTAAPLPHARSSTATVHDAESRAEHRKSCHPSCRLLVSARRGGASETCNAAVGGEGMQRSGERVRRCSLCLSHYSPYSVPERTIDSTQSKPLITHTNTRSHCKPSTGTIEKIQQPTTRQAVRQRGRRAANSSVTRYSRLPSLPSPHLAPVPVCSFHRLSVLVLLTRRPACSRTS